MAKAKPATTQKATTEVAVKAQPSALAVGALDFAADAGAGMEGATSESFAIPFLSILQKSSPQVDEDSGAALPGAKSGMIYDNVTGSLMSGKDGVLIVPCAYRRVFLRWTPRGAPGSGFKGELPPEEVADMRAKGEIVSLDGRLFVPAKDGTVNPDLCDRIADTRNHYVLLLTADGGFMQALLSLTSTQIKKSKTLMSALANVKRKGDSGLYTPPTFANLVKMTTIPESNAKGSWHGAKLELAGFIDRVDIYNAAKAFHSSVKRGTVEVRYEEDPPAGAGGEAEEGSGGGSF